MPGRLLGGPEEPKRRTLGNLRRHLPYSGIASADVLHGVHTAQTNMNTMVVPGYISEVNTTFPNTGRFPMFCNEYCGLGHDYMWSQLNVVSKDEFEKELAKEDE